MILVFAFGVLLLPGNSKAITLNGIYTGTCDRKIGLILHVDKNSIQLLGLDGKISRISRYDITYLTTYPIGNIPIADIENPQEKMLIVVKTLVSNIEEELVRGWPVEFSELSILFLTTEGEEVIVDRENIFRFELADVKERIVFKGQTLLAFAFRYPAFFSHCEKGLDPSSISEANSVYPQQVIGEAILIKLKLDHLMAGHQRIDANFRNQKFYPVPNIYSNDVKIGLWYNVGSRHAISKGRTNNLIPVVINQLNEGPFEFQREIISGTHIISDGIHEEPQTQISYQFKAAYFHFSAMFDPYIILAGSSYVWKKDELEDNDHRVNNLLHVNAGFGFGNLAAEVGIQAVMCAARSGELFALFDCSGLRYGLFYRNRFFRTDFYYTRSGSQTEPGEEDPTWGGYTVGLGAGFRTIMKFYRFNLHLDFLPNQQVMYSLIYHTLNYTRGPDILGVGEFSHESATMTNTIYLDHGLGNDVTIGGYLSVESATNQSTSPQEEFDATTKHYPKLGISVMLAF